MISVLFISLKKIRYWAGVELRLFTGFLETTQTLDQTLESDKLFLRICLKILRSSIFLFTHLTNSGHLNIAPEILSLVMFFTFTLSHSSRNLIQYGENSWTTQLSILIGYYICEPVKTHFHWFSHCEWTAHKPLTLYSNMASASAGGDPAGRKEDCSRFDAGLIYGSTARFSDAKKFEFIQNVWKPDVQFKFRQCDRPQFGELRKFRQKLVTSIPVARVLQISWWRFLLTMSFFRSRIWHEPCGTR